MFLSDENGQKSISKFRPKQFKNHIVESNTNLQSTATMRTPPYNNHPVFRSKKKKK